MIAQIGNSNHTRTTLGGNSLCVCVHVWMFFTYCDSMTLFAWRIAIRDRTEPSYFMTHINQRYPQRCDKYPQSLLPLAGRNGSGCPWASWGALGLHNCLLEVAEGQVSSGGQVTYHRTAV